MKDPQSTFLTFYFRWIVTRFILKQWSLQSRSLLQFRRIKCRTSAIVWRGSGIPRKSWKYFRKNMVRYEQFFLVKTWRRYGNDERFYWSACSCCQTSFCTLVIIFAFDKWGKKKKCHQKLKSDIFEENRISEIKFI